DETRSPLFLQKPLLLGLYKSLNLSNKQDLRSLPCGNMRHLTLLCVVMLVSMKKSKLSKLKLVRLKDFLIRQRCLVDSACLSSDKQFVQVLELAHNPLTSPPAQAYAEKEQRCYRPPSLHYEDRRGKTRPLPAWY
ncbi:hypothetical protein OS493_040203, partial [Desmophyllum pertusum]